MTPKVLPKLSVRGKRVAVVWRRDIHNLLTGSSPSLHSLLTEILATTRVHCAGLTVTRRTTAWLELAQYHIDEAARHGWAQGFADTPTEPTLPRTAVSRLARTAWHAGVAIAREQQKNLKPAFRPHAQPAPAP